MKKIAITGSFGSGKSTVTRYISKQYFTLSCDDINRRLLPESEEVRKAFPECLNEEGNIDTAKLSDAVFTDDEKRKQLEDIMHPLILREIKKELMQHQDDDFCFVEVPLLFEKNWDIYFDVCVLVVTDMDLAIKRLMTYRHMNMEEIQRRLSVQMDVSEKMKLADYLIFNNASYEELEEKINAFLYELNQK